MRPGVRYRETRNSDGTANFHSVPLMGTLKPGARGNAKSVGKEWMQAALEAARADAERGYLAPLKPTHADGVPYVCGYVLPTHIADEQYDDGAMPTLFGDFIAVEPSTAEKLRRGEWPFRSVEIVDWSAPRVNAVALLAADAPHFRFPLFAGTLLDDAMPGRFCAAKLAAFGEDKPESGEKVEEDAEHEKREETTMQSAIALLTMIARKLGLPVGTPRPDAVAQPVTDKGPTGDGEEVAAAAVSDEAEDDGTEADTDEMEAAPKGDTTDTDTDDDGDDDAPAAKKEKTNMAATQTPTTLDAKTTARLAALEGENTALKAKVETLSADYAALKAKNDAAEAESLCVAAIASARTKLKAARVAEPPEFEATCRDLFKLSAASLDRFVTQLSAVRRDPPASFGDAMAASSFALGGTDALEDKIAKFAAGKPLGTLERMREAVRKQYVPMAQLEGGTECKSFSVEKFMEWAYAQS